MAKDHACSFQVDSSNGQCIFMRLVLFSNIVDTVCSCSKCELHSDVAHQLVKPMFSLIQTFVGQMADLHV